MSAIDEFEEAREDLELLLVEVLSSVFAEEAMPVWDDATPALSGTLAVARLEIHDEVEGSFTVVEVRLGAVVARVLASRMLMIPDPTPEDLLDAVGELGNIAGGNVKSLLRHSCRLSLPTAEIVAEVEPHHDAAVVVRGGVLGQVIELSVRAAGTSDGAFWPGATASINSHAGDQGWTRNDVLESQS